MICHDGFISTETGFNMGFAARSKACFKPDHPSGTPEPQDARRFAGAPALLFPLETMQGS